ncbi:efflux RND transporter permease subunit [Suttonella ornithocola]|uniref:Efflux pump membrane transporter n=1 Tax=Suttonella ornithocola TaxID=279832 RepID=A0A380MZF4_9GAMM|nr:efflux RND transporter permease subunit [Suttonella ornithocola]SUO97658.1 Acriflavine resistance protein B [Suttonella ornithocola]
MAKFFIDRPIFAWVVAIFIMLAGIFSASRLAIEQYPNIAAPTINISFSYTGASAETVQNGVISIIEEQMNAVEGVDYMESKAYSSGRGQITLTFRSGMDEDLAQIDVQNKLSQVEPRLPQSVRNTGVVVTKSSSNFLLFAMLYADESGKMTTAEVSDYAVRTVKSALQRVEGVGDVQIFGSERAMRIWVNPEKLKNYDLSFADVNAAISTQNAQVSAGALGDTPTVSGQAITNTISVSGQLTNADEFENIVLKSLPSGATVRLKDVATVELGQQSYSTQARLNGRDSIGIGVQLSSTGNAVSAAQAIREKMTEMAEYFPEGMGWDIPYDTSTFVKISLEKVLHTLVEAIILVFIVMYLFLQNIRYTIIPVIVVPISLLGALALMYPLGLSINVLTMFAMVLVIGIVVDDAIVVVENVERLMVEEGLTPYQAAHKGMTQITGAVIGITLVLISVFVPMAFQSGATGSIMRQFALVMAAAIGFSAFLALSLTPALCATILKPAREDHHEKRGFFGAFNRGFKRTSKAYEGFLAKLIRRSYFMMLIFVILTALTGYTLNKVRTSFLPSEDQGFLITSYQLNPDATQSRTEAVVKEAEKMILSQNEVKNVVSVLGFSFSGSGQNMALQFVSLKDWAERNNPEQSANALVGRLFGLFGQFNQGIIFPLNPPPIPSLGTSDGVDFRLEDRNNKGHAALLAARNQLLGMMAQSPVIASARPSGLEDTAQLVLNINRDKAYAQNVPFSAIGATLSTALGSSYINDFPNNGRMQRVYVQADAKARMQPEDVLNLTVPNNRGELVAMRDLVDVRWENGAQQITRYNGFNAMAISGTAAPGYSSGQAMAEIEKLVSQLDGFGLDWTGQSLEELRAGNSQYFLYGLSLLAVFLCLAALYESWSVPFAVLMVIPLGVLGVALGTMLRGFENDIYFKVGMITVMGLSAKNAILIIEFAKDLQEQGLSKIRAALTAAHLRFRPIIMTSIAFIAGVIPLYIATGASSASQRAIGTSVLWGMLIGTFLSVFLVPIYYVVIRKIFGGGHGVKDKYVATQQSKGASL